MGYLIPHSKLYINKKIVSHHVHEYDITIDVLISETFSKEEYPVLSDTFYNTSFTSSYAEGECVYIPRNFKAYANIHIT